MVVNKFTSTTCPTPECRATMAANAAVMPVTSSVNAIAGNSGGPSGSPLTAARPAIDSAIDANPGRFAYGPSCPKPDTRTMTSFGLRAISTSGCKSRRSSVPGRKFSTNTFASSSRRKNSSRSSASFRSSAMLRLLRLTNFHHKPLPSRGSRHAMPRNESPVSGRSTLITSAPKSAR